MRKVSISLLAAVALLATATLPAAAASYGRPVPLSQEIKDFFAARGVDPQYLDKTESEVPGDQWARILAVVNTPDDPTVVTDDHDVLNSLVGMTLWEATSTYGDPVYITIGNSTWIHELVAD